ncbi:MAG: magnesium-translocating P-type ATPase [Alphaproteobacteria bacterium]|nr:magnesium-translocating P-type ATPase [Alphaproteobacteria bacterium]
MLTINPDFWQNPLSQVLQSLNTTQQGLSQSEAINRLKRFGSNKISPKKETLVIYQLLQRLKNPLVILLLVTSLISLLLRQTSDFFIILIMVFMSVILDFFQEYTANQAAKKLRDSIALKAKVLRNDTLQVASVKNLVPGDIVYLKAGDMIPADGRLIWENHLFVNQAILTGESYPVEKNADDLPTSHETSAPLETAINSVFMGTSVISGEAHMVVCITGDKAYMGSIADSLRQEPPPSQFELETRKFGFFLMKITMFLVLFVLMVNLFYHRPWLETFLFALALAIGMTPEFLPMVMSVTLSRGAKNMAKKHVIVKRLSAIHDLGGMNVLCTDKTGTLTEAKIQLADYIDSQGKENERVLTLAYLNSFFETGLKSPMDEAILNQKKIKTNDWKKIDEIPFDFERRRVSVLLDNGEERLTLVKGAPEDIVSLCTHYERKEQIRSITSAIRKRILSLYKQKSKQGFRILGIAWQPRLKNHEKAVIDDETKLTFAGFVLFYDPPKREASKALENLKSQKIDVYILTGDSEDVTLHLCQELNIQVKGLLTGNEMNSLDDHALAMRVRNTNLYCRVTPSQKRRILLELKSLGYVVGFMGDGINDAPSLYSANVGISVDTGADVAKEAADLIMLKHNLDVVHDAVVEGRKIYTNIIKYLMMMTSSNFGNMVSMAGASLMLPFLPMLPTQILLNNLLYDTSQTAIPFDNVDPESTLSPQQWNLKLILKFMLVMGPLSSVFDFLIFFIMLKLIGTPPALFQTGWFMESLATQILIIFVIRTHKSIFQSKPHIFLTLLAFLLVGIGMIIPYSPLGDYFGFVPPPFYFFMIIIGIVIVYLASAEQIKFWFYKKIS